MDAMKLLIADGNEEFRRALAAELQGACHIRAPLVTPPDPQTQVTNLLLSLNIPSKLRGYAYLREAIPRMMKDPDQPITKVLYPAVGAVFGCKGSDGVIPRPSNAAFFSRLADALRLNQDAGNIEE